MLDQLVDVEYSGNILVLHFRDEDSDSSDALFINYAEE